MAADLFRGTVIAHPQQVEHRRRASSPSVEQPSPGLTPLDESTRVMLRLRHWRKPPRDRRGLWLTVVVVLLLHALFSWVLWHPMHYVSKVPVTSAAQDDAIEIRFIPHARSAVAAPPPPTSPPPVRAPQKAQSPRPHNVAKTEPVAKDAMTVSLPDTPSANAPPKLYDKDGHALLPPPASTSAAPADYVERMPTDTDRVMQHDTPIRYTATRFEKDWHRVGVVDDALQKVVKATTVKKTIELPRGVRIHCAISLAMLAGGCGGDPPPPPPPKDGDERLSMAPSRPLAKDPHPPVSPSIESCIAAYRAAKPLAYGCPIDTPSRAFAAEKAEAARSKALGPRNGTALPGG